MTPAGYLVVARVLRPHGVAGELKCRLVSEFPERFRRGLRLYAGDPPETFVVGQARVQDVDIYLRLEGLATAEAADRLRGLDLLVPEAEAVPLPPGRFYWHQVIGLRAEDSSGTPYGLVRDILETGANHVYVVDGPLGEILIPAIPDVVQAIEPEQGRLVFVPLPGLLPQPPRHAPPARPARPRRRPQTHGPGRG